MISQSTSKKKKSSFCSLWRLLQKVITDRQRTTDCGMPSHDDQSTTEILQPNLRTPQKSRVGGETVRALGPGWLLQDCLLNMIEKLQP